MNEDTSVVNMREYLEGKMDEASALWQKAHDEETAARELFFRYSNRLAALDEACD